MEKKAHQYELTVTYLSNNRGEAVQAAPVVLQFENHDDIFRIIEAIKAKQIFPDGNHATEFAIGLKLFTEVILRYKDHPLFGELKPAIGGFMKKLKST